MMRLNPMTPALILAGWTTLFAQAVGNATINWSDSTRDVYIDNDLDRSAQVLRADSPQRLVLISSKLNRAILLDVAEHKVSLISKDAFRFAPDRTSATSDANVVTQPIGKFTRIDGPIYSFAVDGKPVLIRSHLGATGEMTLDKLWEAAPVWRTIMENYQPNAEAVNALKNTAEDAQVTLALGTWCPDSKTYVPRLLKALHDAGSGKIHLKLVGIDNQFHEPVGTVQPRRITNVPTVIVERDGREIGRIVETPAAKSMEEDLAAILAGKPGIHAGRWERGPLVARGTYSYRDSRAKEIGNESWDLYSTSEGGYLTHSRITVAGLITEVFERVDAKRRPSFAEITKINGSDRTRTRINIDGHTLTARMRGSVSGVVLQTIEVPAQLFLCSPAAATQGLSWTKGVEEKQVAGYIAPVEFDKALGTLAVVSQESKGEELTRVPAGEFRAHHVRRALLRETSDWWLHPELGIPLRGKTAGGLEYLLTSLELSTQKKH